MINHIHISNFKCFTVLDLDLRSLNVLAGANGSGKSTTIQALLLLFQSRQSNAMVRNRLQLNGPLVDLGMGKDVLYKRSDADSIDIAIQADGYVAKISANVPKSEPTHTLDILGDIDQMIDLLFDRKLYYLSADRLGPQIIYPMNHDDLLALGNPLGRRGEFAPLVYSRSRSHEIKNESLILEDDRKQSYSDLGTQFTLWMRRLFPGFDVEALPQDQMDAVRLGLNLSKQYGEPEFLRPTNVGFGVSIAMPIVLAGLLADQETVLIVENPEAHLHPSAQSALGEFLARVAAGGTQVFVETHSDHVVNGNRLAIKNKIISPEAVRFLAFSRTDEYGSSGAFSVEINENAEFESQPELFFDQIDRDLKLIYGL